MISPVQSLLKKTGLSLDPSATEEQKALLQDLAFSLEGKTADARESVQAVPPGQTLENYSRRKDIDRENTILGVDAAVGQRGEIVGQNTGAFKARNSAATDDQIRTIGTYADKSRELMQPQYDFANKTLESRNSNIAGQNAFTASENAANRKFAASQNTQDLLSRLALGAAILFS
jgi:hypothetical protein|tara:strand:- start:592 stop:1116 length:525 start_codon:yes stop_codon:yes gene_type:complete